MAGGILNLTQAVKLTDEFKTFRVDKILDNSVTDFDLFLNVERHLILYGSAGYKWSKEELTRLIRGGFYEFFIKNTDFSKVHVYENLQNIPQIPENLPPRERIQNIQQIGAAFTKLLYTENITPAVLDRANKTAEALVNCIQEDPTCIQALGSLATHDEYTFYHSIRVACYATALAIRMGSSNQEDLKNVALGCLFHDVGKSLVPLAILNKAGPLLEHEWNMMRNHPLVGFEKVSPTLLPHVPREIVLHHHERLGGGGYPHGLKKSELLTEVQIATVADIFDALTSSRAYQVKRTHYEALDFMKQKLVKADISPDVFRALIESLVLKE